MPPPPSSAPVVTGPRLILRTQVAMGVGGGTTCMDFSVRCYIINCAMNVYSPMSVSPPQCVRSFGYTSIPCVGFSGLYPVFFPCVIEPQHLITDSCKLPSFVSLLAVDSLTSFTNRTFVSPFPEHFNIIFGWKLFNRFPDPCVRYRSLLLLCRRQGCTG